MRVPVSVPRVVLVLLSLVLAVVLLAPSGATPTVAAPPAQGRTVTVFAAASLTDAFRELGAIFETNSGVPVTFNFGASSQLRTQLEQGAQADVFASADQVQMNRARDGGLIAGLDVAFAINRLIVITPKRNPAAIQSAADLARPGVRFVTATPDVPIGVYTQSMFDRMSQRDSFGADFKDRANANVVSREPNVRQMVAKVQLGEADAAVVYLTDVTPQSSPDLQVIVVPDDLNIIGTYPIALVMDAPQAELGGAFISLVLSPIGQGVLQRWSFTPVGPTALAPAPAVTHGQ